VAGDFFERIDELLESVGDGELKGSVVVDQVYAQAQHERMDFKHPRGGQAKFLAGPFMNKYRGYLQQIASAVLDGNAREAMTDVVEDLSKEVFDKAPREFWDLRESAHPFVNDDETVVYDRPAIVHRLSEGELKIKARLRSRGLGGGA
jgi:hypothetical protein